MVSQFTDVQLITVVISLIHVNMSRFINLCLSLKLYNLTSSDFPIDKYLRYDIVCWFSTIIAHQQILSGIFGQAPSIRYSPHPLWGIIFRNVRQVHRFILCLNYMMFPLVLYSHLFWGSTLLYLLSPKGGFCSIWDNLSCSCHNDFVCKIWIFLTDVLRISLFINDRRNVKIID